VCVCVIVSVCVRVCVSVVNIRFTQIILKRNNKLCSDNIYIYIYIYHKNTCINFAYYRGDILSNEIPLIHPTTVKHF
jgi:hypothetical protein